MYFLSIQLRVDGETNRFTFVSKWSVGDGGLGKTVYPNQLTLMTPYTAVCVCALLDTYKNLLPLSKTYLKREKVDVFRGLTPAICACKCSI